MSPSRPPKQSRRSTTLSLPAALESALAQAAAQPQDAEAWDALDEVARELDRPEEVAELYREILESNVPLEVLVELGRRGADFCEEWFEEPDPTVAVLTRVLSLDRSQAWAFERLTVLLTSSSSWEKLLQVYDQAIAGAPTEEEKASLLAEAARVARDFAGQASAGSDYLKALLLLRPRDDQLAAGLERRLDEQGRHADLIEIWLARTAILEPDAGFRTRLQIAARYLDQLGDAASSLGAVEDLLASGGSPADASTILERIARTATAPEPTRRRALCLLEELYTRAGKNEELAVALERALLLAETDAERIVFRQKVSALLETLGRNDQALGHAVEILCLDPALDAAKSQAKRLSIAIGRLDLYAGALARAADVARTGTRRIELLIEAGHLHEIELASPSDAIALFSRVLADESADEAAELLAAQELSELLLAPGPSLRLLEVLERRAELETKAGERRRVLGQAAALAAELGDADRSLGLWAACLKGDPADHEALTARIALLDRLGRHQGLVENLQDRARLSTSAVEQRADLVRAAAVYAERLADLPQAIRTWRDIEQKFERNEESLDALVALTAKAERFEDVVVLLREAVRDEPMGVRRVQQLALLGDTFRLHLQQYEQAIVEYATSLTIDSTFGAARQGLFALLSSPSHAHQAAEVLAEALRRTGDAAGILELLETRLGAAPDDAARCGILLEAANLWESRGDLASALRATCRAFALGLEPSVEAEAQRLAVLTADFVTLVSAYQKALERAEGERARRLHFAQGRVWEERLERPAGAAAAYKLALGLGPEHPEVALSLVRAALHAQLFAEAASALVDHTKALATLSPELILAFEGLASPLSVWDDALEALGEVIARAEGLPPQLTHDLKRQLALWHRDQRHDADAAEFVLRRAAFDHPQEDTLRMLAELERRAPGKQLVRTLEALADVTGDELAVLREACEIALRDVKDKELSERLLVRTLAVAAGRFDAEIDSATPSLEVAQTSEWSLEKLVALALAACDQPRAIELLEQAAALPFALDKRIGFRFRAAEVAAALDSDERGVALCQSVLADQPVHEGAITLLSALHEKAGRLRELLELRSRELLLERPLERRLFLRLEQARVLGQLDEDVEARLAALRENLQAAPGHAASLGALLVILLERERFEETVVLLESQAQVLARTEAARAAKLYEQAGNLAADRLQDVPRLVADFKSAVALVPSVPVLDRLAQIAHEKGEFGSEVGFLEHQLGLTPARAGDEIRRSTVVRLAQAQMLSDDAASAQALLEGQLGLDPAAHVARTLLSELYTQGEDWEQLARTLSEGVEYAPDDASRVQLLRSAAQVARRRLGDVASAIPFLDAAAVLAPEDRSLRLLLADALRVQGEFDRARDILSEMLEEFGRRRTKERAMVHQQLARIAQASGDIDEALEQAEAAAKIERNDPGILMLVGRLARQKGQLERAEQAYRTLLLIVSRGAEQPDPEEERVGESSILFELYRLAEEEGQPDRARELLGSALEIATRDPEEALRLESELTAAGKADLLLQALDDRLRAGLERSVAAQVLLTRAQVLSRNGRTEEAFSSRLRAIEFAPEDARLLDSTWKIAEQLGGIETLTSHLTTIASASQLRPEVAGDLWFRLGAELESSDPLRAADLYERAQLTEHRPRRTFAALDKILAMLGDAQRAVDALGRFVAAPGAESNPPALADALYRLGEHELSTRDWALAVEHFELALTRDAKESRVLEALLPVLDQSGVTPELVRLFVRVARVTASADALLRGLLAASALADADQALVVEAIELSRSSGSDTARARLLSRAIQMADAADELGSIRELVVERADLAILQQDFSSAGQLLRRAIALHEGQEAFELELQFAELARGPLADREAATAAYERLMKAEPGQRRVWQPLFGLYREQGRTDDIEARIVEIEPQISDAEDLELLRMERVRILLSAGRFEEAEAVLRTSLAERPDFLEAGTILSELYRDQGRHDELREHLQTLWERAQKRGDGAQVAHYGLALACIVKDIDRAEAIGVLTAGLTWTRERREVLVALLELYGEDDDPADRAEVMEHLLALEKGENAVNLALALAAVRASLGDDYALGRALDLGFRAAPTDARITAPYVEYLESQEDFARLADTRLLQATEAQDRSVAAKFFARAGALFDERLGDPSQAAQAYLRAFEREPEDAEHLKSAVSHLIAVGEIESAQAQISQAIEHADEMALGDLLQLRARTIGRELPDDVDALRSATADLRRALGLFVSEEQAEDMQRERSEFLARLAELHAESGDEAAERDVMVELSRVQVEMNDVSGGVETLAAWLRGHEADLTVARELGELAMKLEDYDTALFASTRLFAGSEGDARILAALAWADAAEKAGSPLEAKEALLTASRERPDDAVLRARLRRTYEAAGAHRELSEMLVLEADATEDPARRSALLSDAANLRLLAEDGPGAAELYELARQVAPEPYVITTKLADCYIEMGEVDKAKAALDAAVEAHGKRRSPELSILQHALARVARVSGDPEAMYSWLETALMSDRNNAEVAAELAVRAQEDKRYDVAVRALQMITLSKTPCSMGKAEAYFRQGQIAEAQGDSKKAALLARRSLTSDEGFPAAQALLDRLGG